MNPAVVTGATGGVGVNLIHELIAREIPVVAVCRRDSARIIRIPVHPLVTTIECDLTALDALPTLIGQPCSVFYHFAWDGTYGESRLDETRQRNNAGFTCSAVRAAKELGCTAFVGAGSQAEYGRVDGVLHPDTPCAPDTAYGRAKLVASVQSRQLCSELGIKHHWCRILSMYGPFDGAHTMVMQAITTMLRGEVFACSPGEQVWDYIYCGDVARAFALVGAHGKDGAIYCVGSGTTRRLREYIAAIRDAVDPSLPIGFGERPYYPHQVMHLAADITNLTADTGFVPKTPFEEGIKKTVAWVRAQAK